MKTNTLFNIALIALILLVSIPLAAFSPKRGFSIGGGAVLETSNTGGMMEIGFPLVEKENLSIRNYIMVTGLGYETGGVLALGEKITIGGLTERGMRPYAFIEGHIGLFKSGSKDLFALPLYFDGKGGGGIDIYASENISFFAEVGGGVNIYGPDITGTAHLVAGFRTFLK